MKSLKFEKRVLHSQLQASNMGVAGSIHSRVDHNIQLGNGFFNPHNPTCIPYGWNNVTRPT